MAKAHSYNHKHRTRVFNWINNELVWEDKIHDTLDAAIAYLATIESYSSAKIYDLESEILVQELQASSFSGKHEDDGPYSV